MATPRVATRTSTAAPTAMLVIAAALWGLSMTGGKYVLGTLGPVTVLAAELVAATVVLWTVLLVRGYRSPASWPRVVALGVLEPAVAYLVVTLGLARTSASNASVITGFESAFVVLLAFVFLRERAERRVLLAVAAALVGLFALEHADGLTLPGAGDALVLCGALSAAGYTIVARGITDDVDPLVLTAHQFAVACAVTLPIAGTVWATGGETIPAHVPVQVWVVTALVGVGGYALSFLLYNRAVTAVPAGTAAVIINLIPAFGFAGAVLLLGEQVTPSRLAGAVLITASVALFTRTSPQSPSDSYRDAPAAEQRVGERREHRVRLRPRGPGALPYPHRTAHRPADGQPVQALEAVQGERLHDDVDPARAGQIQQPAARDSGQEPAVQRRGDQAIGDDRQDVAARRFQAVTVRVDEQRRAAARPLDLVEAAPVGELVAARSAVDADVRQVDPLLNGHRLRQLGGCDPDVEATGGQLDAHPSDAVRAGRVPDRRR